MSKCFFTYSCKAEKRGSYQTHEPMMEIYGNLSRTITSVLHGFQRKSQGFLQIFVVLASLHVRLCAIISRAAHKKQMHTKWSAKLCILKLHSAVMAGGGSLSSGGAGRTQAGSIHQRIWICSFTYWNWHVARLNSQQRRSEEIRGEQRRGEEKWREEKGGNTGLETSLTSGSVLRWLLEWTLSL